MQKSPCQRFFCQLTEVTMRHLFRIFEVFTLILFALTVAARADDTQTDPGKVSEGLKAIFQYGTNSGGPKDKLNANTVTLISGTIGGTYVQFGADLASVLDDGNQLRVLPIVGRGSVQSVADILYLRGVDLGIVRADTLDYLEKNGYAKNIKQQFNYITKLYNEEMHVVAPKSIRDLKDLDGKVVSIDLPNGGTFVTSLIVFERLGIKPKFVYIEQRIAFEKMKKGEVDAVIAVQGKPSKLISQIKDDNLHLVPVDYDKPLQTDYFPAELTAKDYPNLVGEQERVDTIAVPAVLAVYNWPAKTDRYRKLSTFVDAFFKKFPDFQRPPFHPKWKEVSLSAPLRGWERFPVAQQWLDRNNATADSKSRFDQYLSENQQAGSRSSSDKEVLFQQYRAWEAAQSSKTSGKPAAAVR
jgi:TRAP transporter TAXI family solute receptor